MGLTEIQEFNDIIFENFLMHYGRAHDDHPPGPGSGRYPFGSGENPGQHDLSLAKKVSDMKKKGISASDIAKGLGYNSTVDLRAAIAIDKTNRMRELRDKVPMLKNDGLSTRQIASMLNTSESTVRNYLNPNHTEKADRLTTVTNILRDQLKEKHYIDVGPGVEIGNEIGSQERLKTAIEVLKKEGYKEYQIKEPQLGNPGQFTTIKVLGDPTTDRKTLNADHTLIKTIDNYRVDDVDAKYTPLGIMRPKSIDSSRVYINYTQPDGSGGAEKDGLIELRRGVEDVSLGRSMYSQVRIAVDDSHYMKGMALYSDNVPDGYDIVYNTNKKVGTDKYSVFKPMQTIDGKEGSPINWDNPFGASIKKGGQAFCLDQNGNPTKELRVVNKVNDQGDWGEWKKQISAQVLGKQPPPLIKRQLELTYQDKKLQFDEIMALDNPTIKRKLLESFASDCDATAVHLKAKSFPGQRSHVIIPITTLEGGTVEYKRQHGVDGEIYAPNYESGTIVALFRYPHAGTFETPLLRVNNRNREAISVMKNAPDAVGINSKIAERLSGADFDGDTVTVIPTTNTNILSTPALKGLVSFNTKDYKFADPNAKGITSQGKQIEMGKTTNLIADMQYKGATDDEICRAVKHSMVVIDSEKHHLDYKKSEQDNGILELKRKYQGSGGASTLITRAGSPKYVPQTKLASIIGPDGKKHYGINPDTGEFIRVVDTNAVSWKKGNPKKGEPEWIQVQKQVKSTKMAEAKTAEDVYNLMSSRDNPHAAELAYANFAIRMKDLANEARKAEVNTPKLIRDPQAAKEYADEVQSLNSKLAIALKHAPVERQAQIIGNAEYKTRIEANPGLDKEHQKRLKGQCLNGARNALGGKKERILITDREWEAIQKGAISDTMLMNILNNTDTDAVKKRATPRANKELDAAKKATAIAWAKAGYELTEIAERLGVSASTISRIVNE